MGNKRKEVQHPSDIKNADLKNKKRISPQLPKLNVPRYNAGDCVLMKPPKPNDLPYVALVEEHTEANKVKIRWYYRPEDISSEKKDFYGRNELFLSNHADTQSVDCILRKCIVHSYKEYMELSQHARDSEDYYYSRYTYDVSKKKLTLSVDGTDGLCICGLPYNLEQYVQCNICNSRFHPACARPSIANASTISGLCFYRCENCQNVSPSQERAGDRHFEGLQNLTRVITKQEQIERLNKR